MRNISPKSLFQVRGRLFNLIGVLLLLYVAADATILEYYCGNENLGIPSYNQTIAPTHQLSQETETSLIADASEQSSSVPGRENPQSPAPSHECICSCAHVLVSSYHFEPQTAPLIYRQQHTFYSSPRHSKSHLQGTFRPPRFTA